MAGLGIWKLGLGPSHSLPPGRIGKGPKSHCNVCDLPDFDTVSMNGILGHLKLEYLLPLFLKLRKRGRIID